MSDVEDNGILSSIKNFFSASKNVEDLSKPETSKINEGILAKYKIDPNEVEDEVKRIVSKETGVERVKELFRYE